MSNKKPETAQASAMKQEHAPLGESSHEVPTTLADAVNLFGAEDTSGYYEGMDAGAYAIPFLVLLQALSPMCVKGTPAYIPEAEPGMIFNTVTKKLSRAVHVTVLRRSHSLCRWTPRDLGGGFISEEEADVSNIAAFNKIIPDDKKRRIIIADGKKIEITEHRNFWVAVLGDHNTIEPALVSMTKSNLGSARSWNTNIDIESAKVEVQHPGAATKARVPVLHSGIWELSTQQKTKEGNTWFVWSVKFLGLHSDRATVAGVREKVAIARDNSKVNRALEYAAEPKDEAGRPVPGPDDDDIPF
jgi:hypothetical protein